MKKYIYQKFLLQCEYNGVDLKEYTRYEGNLDYVPQYGEEYCLFDINRPIIRQISVSELDEKIDTLEDWETFVHSLRGIDTLVVKGTEVQYENPIMNDYRGATIKAYLKRLADERIRVLLC